VRLQVGAVDAGVGEDLRNLDARAGAVGRLRRRQHFEVHTLARRRAARRGNVGDGGIAAFGRRLGPGGRLRGVAGLLVRGGAVFGGVGLVSRRGVFGRGGRRAGLGRRRGRLRGGLLAAPGQDVGQQGGQEQALHGLLPGGLGESVGAGRVGHVVQPFDEDRKSVEEGGRRGRVRRCE